MSSVNGDSTTTCKNRQYTQSMKTTFQFINVAFSLLICILMVVVCFAFSYNVKMIQDVPFIVQTISFEVGGVQDQACYYMGMRGVCFAVCGAVTVFYPADSTYRSCNQQSSISYSQQVSTCNEQPVGAWHVMSWFQIKCPLSHISLSCKPNPTYFFLLR
jgi:hypothetical protein